MEIRSKHIIGFTVAFLILLVNFAVIGISNWIFKPVFILALVAGGIFFLLDFLNENKRQKEIETKFLEFVRALVENVKSGIPIPSATIQVSNADYGALTPYVKKLAHQIEWGYPFQTALNIFADDTKNRVVKKSIAIVTQAEKSGGDMSDVLEAVTNSVLEVKKIKEERRTNSYSQIIQGYIIFFVFIIIMLVMQVYLLPKIGDISSGVLSGMSGTMGRIGSGGGGSFEMEGIFMALVVVQGFFAGLMVGKFSEGEIKAGLKHAILMIVIGYLIITTITGLLTETPETVAPLVLLTRSALKK